jgi:hypothetical protein
LLIETLNFVSKPGARALLRIPISSFDYKFPGGLTARVTPVPIPNTEVKPCRADDTALETTRERRSPPGLKSKAATPQAFAAFFYFVRDNGDLVEPQRRLWALTSKNETIIATISRDDLSNLDDASRGRA